MRERKRRQKGIVGVFRSSLVLAAEARGMMLLAVVEMLALAAVGLLVEVALGLRIFSRLLWWRRTTRLL